VTRHGLASIALVMALRQSLSLGAAFDYDTKVDHAG
jgi:hypothetical protein